MGKYEPLRKHLEKSELSQVSMSFAEIERVVGFNLPPSSRKYRAWWSNNASNSAITHAWLDAGFQTEQVNMEKRRLIFRRTDSRSEAPEVEGASRPARHPLLGCMKGSVTYAPDFEPGEPADPEWGRAAYGGDA
jgi:hypothetical protein